MAQESDNSIGSSDIAMLLDLLNSSEVEGENIAVARPPLWGQFSASEPADEGSSPRKRSTSDQVDLSTGSEEIVDNRFAAHIVYAMSKLKRT